MRQSQATVPSGPPPVASRRIGPVEVIPAAPAIGAEIRGVDLSQTLPAETILAIKQAWQDHLVLLFRDQDLTPEQHITFSAYFGLPQSPNRTSFTPMTEKYPEIVEVQNVDMEEERIERSLSNAEAFWHTDMSYKENPPSASALYAREIPPEGGNTCVCNMYMAYDDLPPDLLAAAEGRKAVHDASRNSAGRLRPGYKDERDPRKTPGPHHPLIRTHPVTGRKALFLGRRPYSYVPGLTVEDSEALLDRLWAHAAQEQYAWCHEWRVGDLLLWDNCCAMHRRDAFDMKYRRVLHRTQIAGGRPY